MKQIIINILKKIRHIKISNKTYNIIRLVCLSIAGIVLIYVSYNLMDSYLNYKEDEKKYASINEMFQQTTVANENNSKNKDNSMSYSTSLTTWTWNYKAMLQYNDESRGYIKLNDSRIQYPIVAHNDNKFYLTHGSDKVSNGAGAIFLDSRTQGLNGRMSILYGHNMLDGAMFADIMKYRENKFAKKHQIYDIYIGEKHYLYYVFATFSTKVTNDGVYKFGFKDDAEYTSWINGCVSRSSFKFDYGIPNSNDKVIMCSTCVDDYGNRQIVCLYRGEEVLD